MNYSAIGQRDRLGWRMVHQNLPHSFQIPDCLDSISGYDVISNSFIISTRLQRLIILDSVLRLILITMRSVVWEVGKIIHHDLWLLALST